MESDPRYQQQLRADFRVRRGHVLTRLRYLKAKNPDIDILRSHQTGFILCQQTVISPPLLPLSSTIVMWEKSPVSLARLLQTSPLPRILDGPESQYHRNRGRPVLQGAGQPELPTSRAPGALHPFHSHR